MKFRRAGRRSRHGAGSARPPAARSAATHRERPHGPAWSGAPATAAESHINPLALEADRASDALCGVTRLPEGRERLHHREELAPAGVKPSALEVAERLVGEREEAVDVRLEHPRRSQRTHLRRLLAQEWQRQADGLVDGAGTRLVERRRDPIEPLGVRLADRIRALEVRRARQPRGVAALEGEDDASPCARGDEAQGQHQEEGLPAHPRSRARGRTRCGEWTFTGPSSMTGAVERSNRTLTVVSRSKDAGSVHIAAREYSWMSPPLVRLKRRRLAAFRAGSNRIVLSELTRIVYPFCTHL